MLKVCLQQREMLSEKTEILQKAEEDLEKLTKLYEDRLLDEDELKR